MRKLERESFLDILKFIALIMMVIIHTTNVIVEFGIFTSNSEILMLNSNIIYLVSPTIFMFAMGASLHLTKNKDGNSFIRRGIKTLIISLILNLIRGILMASFYAKISEEYGLIDFITEVLDWTVGNDILMFAGLYFIIFGFIFKLKKNNELVLIITSVIFYVVSLLIPIDLETSSLLLDSFLGNFILIGEAYFPILSWFIIPTIAYEFFKYFKSSKNQNKFMLNTLLISSLVFGLVFFATKITNSYEERYLLWGEDLFYFDLPTLILTLSLNYVYIPIIYYLSKLIEKTRTYKSLITFESINLTKVYLIHWIIVILSGILMYLNGIEISKNYIVIIYGLFVLMLSSAITFFVKKVKGEE